MKNFKGKLIELALTLEEWQEGCQTVQVVLPHHSEVWSAPDVHYGRVPPHPTYG